ncbi:MAG: hypothetical protein JNM32_05310 [Dechloromonas sp.]|nr:hypothetical protein [Dechloromonas sp.]
MLEAICRAEALPLAWALLDERIRRVLINRFPYGVLYVPQESGILIVAVMHLSREPDYWRSRT